MRAVICAIHGIDSTNESSFVDAFKNYCAYADPQLTVITHEYTAGPFPLWNNWVENERIANDVFDKIQATKGHLPIFLVAHSNGTVIARRVAQMLVAVGDFVSGLILIAGAIESNIDRNGVLDMFKAQKLRFVCAYCSTGDEVVRGDPRVDKAWYLKLKDRIWGWLMWPYGSLGVTGWLYRNDKMVASDIVTRWYKCSHSGYFEGNLRNIVFKQILLDIRFIGRRSNGSN
jgi:pimeloyl-ACP methyl ester carboxylesterase